MLDRIGHQLVDDRAKCRAGVHVETEPEIRAFGYELDASLLHRIEFPHSPAQIAEIAAEIEGSRRARTDQMVVEGGEREHPPPHVVETTTRILGRRLAHMLLQPADDDLVAVADAVV